MTTSPIQSAPAERRCPVLDFDHHSPRVSAERQAVLEEVRKQPIFWTDRHDGYWVASSYETVRRAFRDREFFETTRHADGRGGVTIPPVNGPRLLPAEVDGEEHRRLKRVMLHKLDKAHVAALRPQIEAIVTAAIDDVIANGPEFDVVHDLADVVPARIIVTTLGFPEEERLPFIRAVQDSVSMIPSLGELSEDGPTPEQQAAIETLTYAITTIQNLIAARRAAPQDDMMSAWLTHEAELTDDEALWMCFTLILGGAENPAALIENALLCLDEDRRLRERLRANPGEIPVATEELLRHITPGVSLTRNVVKDTELGGQPLRAGERVLIWLPAAHRDGAVFEDPDTLDIDRDTRAHMAFGTGVHMCPGRFLTKLTFQLLLEQVLERMPDYAVDVEACERVADASLAYIFRTMPATTGL